MTLDTMLNDYLPALQHEAALLKEQLI